MNTPFDTIQKIRTFLLSGISDLTIQQMNEIPPGFNNNIIWNLGHLVASQQGICYLRAGLKAVVDENFVLEYKSGSKPEKFADEVQFDIVKDLLLSSVDRLETDYNNNVFTSYNSWTTRYGITIISIEDALRFLPFHDGLHMGNIMTLKRLIKKGA